MKLVEEIKLTNNDVKMRSMPKTIALVDPYTSGHHLMSIKIFLGSMLELGHTVVVLCHNPTDLDEWVNERYPSMVNRYCGVEFFEPRGMKFFSGRINALLNNLYYWYKVKVALQSIENQRNIRPDLVFFAWLDTLLQPFYPYQIIDAVFPYRWSGVYFHPRFARIKRKRLSGIEFLIRPDRAIYSKNCTAVVVYDEGILDKLVSRWSGTEVVWFPDISPTSLPEEDYPLAKIVKEKANGRHIIGLIGSISKRKGILEFLEVVEKAPADDFYFVLAGQLNKSDFNGRELAKIESFLNSDMVNCLVHLERIPSEESFNALIDVCDILYIFYKDFPHSSNVLFKAATYEKPVIVSESFCMGERVSHFKLGVTLSEDAEVDEILQAIQFLADSKSNDGEYRQHDFVSFRQVNSPEALCHSFAELISKIDK